MTENQVKVDYLTEDDELKNQKFVCLSFLSPEGISNCSIRGLKVRGVYSTYEEATKRAQDLRETDKYFHVFVGEVGKWLPWDPNPDSEAVEEENYAEQQLQDLMKSYRQNQADAAKFEKSRKAEMIDKNIEHNLNTRRENKEMVSKELQELRKRELNEEEKLIEKNLEKTLENIDEEIAKLEKKSKSVGDAKKSTYQKLEENRVDEEDLEKTTKELEESKALYNKLVAKEV